MTLTSQETAVATEVSPQEKPPRPPRPWEVRALAATRPPTPAYEDEHVVLYQGMFQEVITVLQRFGKLPPVHHTITDPPYSDRVHRQGRRLKSAAMDSLQVAKRSIGFKSLDVRTMREFGTLVGPLATGWTLVFCDDQTSVKWKRRLPPLSGAEHVRQGIYNKLHPTPQLSGDRPAQCLEYIEMFLHPTYWYELIDIFHKPGKKVWNGGGRPARYEAMPESDPLHKATKPLGLMHLLVEDFTKVGHTVLDPFCGTGTTLLACRNLGRKAIGIEMNPEVVEAAAQRLRQMDLFPLAGGARRA